MRLVAQHVEKRFCKKALSGSAVRFKYLEHFYCFALTVLQAVSVDFRRELIQRLKSFSSF